ncbi:RagB/SusD family nutrient uptake outer membrane protein [Niabella insulamsoli]|uniref:RagB/SusD family nutrient uptake outer membrane protein n=1 Tax=Niabella insulamsoli TaxID=3144874 RepID=UPI0031FBEC8E
MKNIYVLILATFMLFGAACNKSFLEVDPKALQIEENYYKNPQEAFNGLVAAYDPLSWEGVSQYANFVVFVAGADECYSGGGSSSDLPYLQALNNYSISPGIGPQLDFWKMYFVGVARSNTIINILNNKEISGLAGEVKARYIAEAKILRAYYYFSLVRLFRNIPFYTEPVTSEEIYNLEQVDPATVYAQVEKDLTEAIAEGSLPDKVDAATEGGRMTRGIAKALLGKVYLYEEKWPAAASVLAEVNGTPGSANDTYGYKLLDNFADIFNPEHLHSSESILEFNHTATASSGWGNTSKVEGLIATTMLGPRSYKGSVYVFGWGGCPIIPEFSQLMYSDPRYQATIADVDSLVGLGEATYAPGYLNTGKFVRKYAPLLAYRPTTGGPPPLNYPQNYIEIRLADTYLMEAEALLESGGSATRAGQLLNAVRARVGLPAVAATLENIYLERRKELATEGHRWFDLVRWGQAATVLAYKGFTAGKNEIFPIPLAEMNNTKLVQNPGY